MSKCISRHGEYSSHILNHDFACERCAAFDEDAALDEIARLREEVAESKLLPFVCSACGVRVRVGGACGCAMTYQNAAGYQASAIVELMNGDGTCPNCTGGSGDFPCRECNSTGHVPKHARFERTDMNDEDGTGLAYADQRAAEDKIAEWRGWANDTLDQLRALNLKLDSLSLDNLITVRGEDTPR